MKHILFIIVTLSFINPSQSQGVSINGKATSVETNYVNRNGKIGTSGLSKNGKFQLTANSLGQIYQGGIIGYFLQPGDPGYDAAVLHGIIVSPVDNAVNTEWGCQNTFVGATSTAFGSGQANTTAIVNGCGTALIAAKICDDLVLNGYSDWFLPSRDEMNKLYLNRAIIGGFSNQGYYWSSTECNGVNAVGFGFDNGDNGYGCGTKHDSNNIRAIRFF